jgi:hypothetical protein
VFTHFLASPRVRRPQARRGRARRSSLLSRAVPVTAVAEWMGHSGPEITWRHYSYY